MDEDNLIDESGGHTLQVCFSSKCLGGGVLGWGFGEEEPRFSACPELMVTRLIMEPMDENEAIIITVSEREEMEGKGEGGWEDGQVERKEERSWEVGGIGGGGRGGAINCIDSTYPDPKHQLWVQLVYPGFT